jgi:uncharacterized protein YbjT (DUF2867 family)
LIMILVVGASGFLGGMITRGLLAQGKPVRILTRSNPAYEELVGAGAEPVPGDLKDRASLDAACKGVEVVITTANAAQRIGSGDGSDTFESVDLHGTLNLVQAAVEAGVEQFIYTSALAVDANSPNPLIAAKARVEQALVESGLNYTILAPHIFMEVWFGMVIGTALGSATAVTLVGEGNHRHSFVSVPDVAAIALAAVGNVAAYNQRIAIGGAEALSWTEVVQRTGRVIGRDLPITYVAMGSPLPFIPAAWDLMYSTETYEGIIPMEEVMATYGITLTPFEQVVGRMFQPQGSV